MLALIVSPVDRLNPLGGIMKAFRAGLFLFAIGAVSAISATADAAPRVLLRGCAAWTMPFCLMMKATDGKTYQLLDAGPAFPAGTRVMVYADRVGDVGLCFAPTAKVVRFRTLPPGPC